MTSFASERAVRREGDRELPLGPKAQRTREAILAAAADRFGAQGYQRTTVSDVAEAAGVSLGTVYQYFRDRSELVAALVRRSIGILVEGDTTVFRMEDGREALERYLGNFVRFYATWSAMAGVWEEVSHVDEDLADLRRRLARAFTDPVSIAAWLAPGDMTAEVHGFDYRVGGGYQMSLLYPAADKTSRGKTSEREDKYTARFVELTPPSRIVEAITFDSADPIFAGEMTMAVTFIAEDGGTTVTIEFENIPQGIRPEDNEAGTKSTLEKLAAYVE